MFAAWTVSHSLKAAKKKWRATYSCNPYGGSLLQLQGHGSPYGGFLLQL